MKNYYDQHTRTLSKLKVGDSVYYKKSVKDNWAPATIIEICNEPNSYVIIKSKIGTTYRRNRQHILFRPNFDKKRNLSNTETKSSESSDVSVNCKLQFPLLPTKVFSNNDNIKILQSSQSEIIKSILPEENILDNLMKVVSETNEVDLIKLSDNESCNDETSINVNNSINLDQNSSTISPVVPQTIGRGRGIRKTKPPDRYSP